MPAKIFPTDNQIKQQNVERLTAIFKLPPEYYVEIHHHDDLFLVGDLRGTNYHISIGKSPKQVSVPAKNKPGWFSKPFFKTVTRYTRVARMVIEPYNSPLRSFISLTGNQSENTLLAAMIDKASNGWIFEKGETKDITLDIYVYPESDGGTIDV